MVLNQLLPYLTLNCLVHLAKEYGGFRNRKVIDFFVRFAKVCFETISTIKLNIG